MTQNILIGTGTEQIYSATFSSETGKIENNNNIIPCGKGPTWLLPTKDKKRFYSVNEHSDMIQVFDRVSTEEKNEKWTKTAEFPSAGETPCYLEFVPGSNESAFVCANYNQNMTVFDTNNTTDFSNSTKPSFIHQEKETEPVGPQKDRQDRSHPHMAIFEPHQGGKFLLVPDLGTDSIVAISRSNNNNEYKIVNKVQTSKPGLGPRHAIYHPKKDINIVYVVNELGSSVSVYQYSTSDEDDIIKLQELETFSCLPPGKSSFDYGGSTYQQQQKDESTTSFGVAQNTCASINIDPLQNKFLYVSCRGRDVITGFELDEKTGRIIKCIGEFPAFGRTPRFFCFSQCGKFVIVLNQDTDSVAVFKFNQENGEFVLPPVCLVNGIKSPQCLVFV